MEIIPKDENREFRIYDEAIVDAYGEEERALGWYYFMDAKLHCPFQVKCITKRGISPLEVGEEVEIQGLASEEKCMKEIFVEINWQGRHFAVPLSQLEAIEDLNELDELDEFGEETLEAIEDWHYWVARGYQY